MRLLMTFVPSNTFGQLTTASVFPLLKGLVVWDIAVTLLQGVPLLLNLVFRMLMFLI